MTVPLDAAGAYVVCCKILSVLGVVGLLATLGACAGENAASMATPATAAAPAAPAAAPVATAATTATAPKAAPQVLTSTEINEQCWMSNEVNKMKDLGAKAKFVDRCVAEKMKAQGM